MAGSLDVGHSDVRSRQPYHLAGAEHMHACGRVRARVQSRASRDNERERLLTPETKGEPTREARTAWRCESENTRERERGA